mmetsp:Transcript_20668/g.60061  ORF Transcript_20668/g.60061 Transcript_20668/m.60061 type:complete len:203 (+) Transcript_20668:1456-2064(+)
MAVRGPCSSRFLSRCSARRGCFHKLLRLSPMRLQMTATTCGRLPLTSRHSSTSPASAAVTSPSNGWLDVSANALALILSESSTAACCGHATTVVLTILRMLAMVNSRPFNLRYRSHSTNRGRWWGMALLLSSPALSISWTRPLTNCSNMRLPLSLSMTRNIVEFSRSPIFFLRRRNFFWSSQSVPSWGSSERYIPMSPKRYR